MYLFGNFKDTSPLKLKNIEQIQTVQSTAFFWIRIISGKWVEFDFPHRYFINCRALSASTDPSSVLCEGTYT